MKILLEIAYKGTAYHGWQSQGKSGKATVQGTLSDACEKVIDAPCLITGVSRTDAGVHANQYFCTLESEKIRIPVSSIPYALNSLLPSDISVLSASECDEEFHARYSCKKKEYIYLFHDHGQRDPFLSDRAYHLFTPLNVDRMNEAAKVLVGKHDFSSFCSTASDAESKVRTIYSLCVSRRADGLVEMSITGDGFLYNMVRIIAGTLVGVSSGKFTPQDIAVMIEKKDRSASGMTAPPEGLYLNRVFY